MYLARYNYEVVGGKLHKIEFIDDIDYIDEFGNPIQLSEDEYLKKVYDYKRRWYNSEFYEQAKTDIPKILTSVLADTNRNGEITEDSMNILQSMLHKYGVFINERRFNNILNDKKRKPGKKIVALSETFVFADEKQTFEEFKEVNKGKTKWELNDHKQIENRLLDIFQTTLTSENHYMDATVPLDFATDALKEAVKIVDGFSNINKNYKDAEPLFPLYQESVKTQNVGADAGIGPMALINTFRVIMQISKLKIDKTIELTVENGKKTFKRNLVRQLSEIGDLYNKFDVNGVSIMDWTSALINAHVDAAKDSYITRLNVNSYTYDVVALLTSAGVGINQFYFLSQPILKQISEEAIRRSSAKIGLSKKEKRDRRWTSAIANNFAKNAKMPAQWLDKLNDGELTIEWKGEQRNIAELIFDGEWLQKQLEDHYNKNLTPEWYRNQVLIYEFFKDIQSYSKSLSALVLASQVDTGKMGKNEAEILLSMHNIEKCMSDPHFINAEDVFNKTFLGRKMNNSANLLFETLRNEILEFSNGFVNLVNTFGRLSNTYFDRKPNNINKYMSEIKFAIQAEFFNEYCKQNNINIKELFYGDNTVVDRMAKLRSQILSGIKHQDLVDNELIKMLIPGLNREGKPKRFETVMKLRDAASKDAYTYAWRDLLEHRDKEVRKLANDLILYSFYTSGGRGTGIYATLDLVPFEVLGNMSYYKDGVDYTYNEHLRDVMKMSINNALNAEKYIEYAFRALQGAEDIVQLAITPRKSYISDKQEKDGKIIYFTTDKNAFVTADGNPSPFLRIDEDLYKLVGIMESSSGTEPVYALTNSINYKERGFTINEGTLTSAFDENKREDSTDLHIPFNEKFIGNAKFISLNNPFTMSNVTTDQEVNKGYQTQEDEVAAEASYQQYTIPTTKIISGGQTGIDRLGLEIGKELGLETGGTTTPGYYTENGPDTSLQDFGVTEIAPELQAGRKGKEFYLPRTEQNVINSDGTVYFATNEDSAGRIATQRFAKKHNKPFLLNPTSQELAQWLVNNNINTLNVAGNRGSKVSPEFDSQVRETIRNAFNMSNVSENNKVTEDNEELRKPEANQQDLFKQPTKQSSSRKTYSGLIDSLEPNQIFVFGSNTQGRHGKGAALIAKNKFGAEYGNPEGPQGQSYAIITKDLTKRTHPSRTPEQIKEQIHNLYEYAKENPDKEFLVAYSGTGQNLNAYSNQEMADMFGSEPIPNNIVFEQEFNKLIPTEPIQTSSEQSSGTINIYAGTNENADLSNFAIRPISTTDFVKYFENWEKPELIYNVLMSLGVSNTYQTVEGAFQASKIYYSNTNQNVIPELRKKLMVASGAKARSLGRSIKGLNKEAWDRDSSDIMKILLIVSFKQNPNAAQRLLSTGNATLTHTQDKGKWGTEFPRILMEVREELRQELKYAAIFNATFKEGTIVDGVDVGGRTIEDVYQSVIKKSGKRQAPSKSSRLNLNPTNVSKEKRELRKKEVIEKYGNPINYTTTDGIITVNFEKGSLEVIPFAGSITDSKGESLGNKDINYFVGALKVVEDLAGTAEDFSYTEGYLPLWQEWARQNPELIEELREKAKGKTLTDKFANTRANQARALADILNSTSNTSTEFNNKDEYPDNAMNHCKK